MGMLKRLIVGLAIVCLAVVVVGFILPARFSVSRTARIEAPVEVVFDHVNTLARWQEWDPWREDDPAMQVTANDVPGGVGAAYRWSSETFGEGELTIVDGVPNQRIVTQLDFGSKGTARGSWTFRPIGREVVVTWTLQCDAGWNLVWRYLGLFIDASLGPRFERGLANLKRVCEST